MTLYGILDDFGEVLRWLDYKPSEQYKYITKKVSKPKNPTIDWSNFEPALF